jgi:membrane-bound ClpP family serine protease
MNTILVLFLVGIGLLSAEVFVPGAVLGILGGLAMAVGCGVAFGQLGVGGGVIATVAALGLLGLMLYAELVWLPKTRLGRAMIVQATIATTSQQPLATAAIVGKTAEAETPLAPSGYVLVEGRRYEAFSPEGHVAKGAVLRVTGQDNFRLIVVSNS